MLPYQRQGQVREGGIEPPLPKDGIEPPLTPSCSPTKVLSQQEHTELNCDLMFFRHTCRPHYTMFPISLGDPRLRHPILVSEPKPLVCALVSLGGKGQLGQQDSNLHCLPTLVNSQPHYHYAISQCKELSTPLALTQTKNDEFLALANQNLNYASYTEIPNRSESRNAS